MSALTPRAKPVSADLLPAGHAVGALAGEARADRQIAGAGGDRLEQQRQVRRQHLAVGVHVRHQVEVAGADPLDAGAERSADAAVHGVADHLGAGGTRDLGGGVLRAVVDHQHGRRAGRQPGQRAQLTDEVADVVGLVERRQEDARLHAA
jgi:hypothetical protein